MAEFPFDGQLQGLVQMLLQPFTGESEKLEALVTIQVLLETKYTHSESHVAHVLSKAGPYKLGKALVRLQAGGWRKTSLMHKAEAVENWCRFRLGIHRTSVPPPSAVVASDPGDFQHDAHSVGIVSGTVNDYVFSDVPVDLQSDVESVDLQPLSDCENADLGSDWDCELEFNGGVDAHASRWKVGQNATGVISRGTSIPYEAKVIIANGVEKLATLLSQGWTLICKD